jgi:hypothetical protein
VDSLEDLEIAVPVDQRPVNELSALKEAFLYNWVSMMVTCSACGLVTYVVPAY